MKKYVKSTKIESSIQVSGYDDASRKLKALSDGEIIQYTGNKLGGVVEAVANALEVGDEFTISAEVGYIAPGPDNDGTHTITTTFLVTDAYRYGNGYAPIYQGRSPQLNANQSRRWRDITNGALWLLGNREYTIVIHKSSQSITSATTVEGGFNMKRKFTAVPGKGIFAAEDTKRDIMELPTSERCDLIKQMRDESEAYFISIETAMKWFEDHGWDTSNYSREQYDSDWSAAAEFDSYDKYEDEYDEDEYDEDDDSIDWIETRADARRWLNDKQKEYGSTYFFPAEEQANLDKLVEKFGNTYFWDREALED